MKIKSITDVITNSSTEVFCYKRDSQEFKDLCEFLGPELSKRFDTVDSLEDIWKLIESGDCDYRWEGLFNSTSEQCRVGNYDEWKGLSIDPLFGYSDLKDTMSELIEKGIKTKREIFDFFAPIYKEALNVAYYSFESDCSYDDEFVNKYNEFYHKRRLSKLNEIFSKFKKGDILQFKPRENLTKENNWTSPIIGTFECNPGIEKNTGKIYFKNIYMPDVRKTGFNIEIEFCNTEKLEETGMYFFDMGTAEPATPEQIKEYNKVKEEYGDKDKKQD